MGACIYATHKWGWSYWRGPGSSPLAKVQWPAPAFLCQIWELNNHSVHCTFLETCQRLPMKVNMQLSTYFRTRHIVIISTEDASKPYSYVKLIAEAIYKCSCILMIVLPWCNAKILALVVVISHLLLLLKEVSALGNKLCLSNFKWLWTFFHYIPLEQTTCRFKSLHRILAYTGLTPYLNLLCKLNPPVNLGKLFFPGGIEFFIGVLGCFWLLMTCVLAFVKVYRTFVLSTYLSKPWSP